MLGSTAAAMASAWPVTREASADGPAGTVANPEDGTTGAWARGAEANVGRVPCSSSRPAPTAAVVTAIAARTAITILRLRLRLRRPDPFPGPSAPPDGGEPAGGTCAGPGHDGGAGSGARGGPGGRFS